MNRRISLHRRNSLALGTTALLSLAACACGARADSVAAAPVEALVYSTMPSTAAHRPEMALDGDANTYFKSVYNMDDGDDFLILLSQPIPVKSIRIATGDTEGNDLLTSGYVETAPDSTAYTKAATFNAAGIAEASLGGKPVSALRIRLSSRRGIPSLLIREITIDSPVKIERVLLGPGRGFVDISRTPDLADWAARAEKQMEESWADTAALLYTDKFITPNAVNVVYRTGPNVTPVAATGGGVMTVNGEWARKMPKDTGLTVHETAHVIQAFSAYNPVWLVEGIADYCRWVKFEPENFHPRINVQKATYHDSYQTTATFLGWCELHYDSRLVSKLSEHVRFATYRNDLWKKYCGKDVDALWAEFIAAYQADPAHILTPVVPAADRPRLQPTVKAGSSVTVDLSSVFNATGIYKDGATFSGDGGFDGGGAAYPASQIDTTLNWKGVAFKLGPAGAADVIASKGNTIALPEGNHASLWLLGAAVDGNQRAQTFTVTYTDGTKEEFSQNLSDWYVPQSFPGEGRAIKSAYRTMGDGSKDNNTFYVYSYGFPLNPAKTVKSVTLPNNENVRIMAITLAD